MGEYATYKGDSIKIGTCEDMYYLRYDQRHLVTPEAGSVDPVKDAGELRFRFPWPDEDHIPPGGQFHDYNFDRSIAVDGFTAPEGVEHYSVQFVAQAGYNVCLPCPEAFGNYVNGAHGGLKRVDGDYTVHRNGCGGAVRLVRQRYIPALDRLVPILKCGACGGMWREEEMSRIEELAVRLRSMGDRRPDAAKFYHAIADRVLGVGAA